MSPAVRKIHKKPSQPKAADRPQEPRCLNLECVLVMHRRRARLIMVNQIKEKLKAIVTCTASRYPSEFFLLASAVEWPTHPKVTHMHFLIPRSNDSVGGSS